MPGRRGAGAVAIATSGTGHY